MKKDEELKDKCLDHLQKCYGDMAQLQQDRETSLKAYMQQPYGNEVEGRSQVVMSDVHDTIEWAMPQLMRVFWGGTDPVKISAIGPLDEIKAKLLQQKVNYDLQRGMNGYMVMHDWFKDALLYDLGVLKYWWEEREEYDSKEYEGLTQEEYDILLQDPDFEVDEVEEEKETTKINDPMAGEIILESVTYEVKGRKKYKISKPMAEIVPPEEFIFDITMKDVCDADFVAHRKRMHKNEVFAKWKVDDNDVEDTVKLIEHDQLYSERFADLGGTSFIRDDEDKDFLFIYECYVYEYDKKGNKQAKKVTVLGNTVLEVEDNSYGEPPFALVTPERITHRAVGRGYGKLVGDIQKMHTAVVRFLADNIYFNDNARLIVDPTRVVMEDVLDNNRPGGVIRTRGGVPLNECVHPLPTKPLPPQVMTFMEVVRQLSENRTGITRFNMGTDTSSVNRTATGISQMMSAGQSRLELVARNFSEGGVKRLFNAFAKMNVDYLDREVAIQVNEEWQTVNPKDIDIKFDVAVSVGIGTGTSEMQTQQLLQMLNVTVPLMQVGVVTPVNIYNTLSLIYQNLGYRNVDQFITNPAMAQMQQQMMGGVPGGFNPGGMAAANGQSTAQAPPAGGTRPIEQSSVSRVFQGNINPNFQPMAANGPR